MATKRSATTKDIGLLKQLHDQGQLSLAPEFQRNSVWPRSAKAYLIDTILNDQPIPLVFLQRVKSAQTGRPGYAVIDGQQRLRAIFEFLDNRFRLSESSKSAPYHNKKYSELAERYKEKISTYDLAVQELTGYTDDLIKDAFVRMNRYVVKLSSQELRHAKGEGKFAEFVERIGRWEYWRSQRIFTEQQHQRMRPIEFAAELAILLIEGPQDKKSAVDLYYGEYQKSFSKASWVERRLKMYFKWLRRGLPDLKATRFASATDFYSLVGAIHEVSNFGDDLNGLNPRTAGERLRIFSNRTRHTNPVSDAARYLAAASRQTDNIQPRTTRIEILTSILSRR